MKDHFVRKKTLPLVVAFHCPHQKDNNSEMLQAISIYVKSLAPPMIKSALLWHSKAKK